MTNQDHRQIQYLTNLKNTERQIKQLKSPLIIDQIYQAVESSVGKVLTDRALAQLVSVVILKRKSSSLPKVLMTMMRCP